MGEGGARFSDAHQLHQCRVSVVPFSGIALPVTKETYPFQTPADNGPPVQQTSNSNGPPEPQNPYTNGPPVSSKCQEETGCRHRCKLPKRTVLGAKILFLALVVMAMFLPLFAKIHDVFLARAHARRVYTVRTLKHRTAYHFQPAMNWMNDLTGTYPHKYQPQKMRFERERMHINENPNQNPRKENSPLHTDKNVKESTKASSSSLAGRDNHINED